jgi:hypothetical protein
MITNPIPHLLELPPKNESFMSMDNLMWFHFVVNYLPPENKPVVFLPCGNANKTREKNAGRKFISQGMSHQLMSKITRNPNYTKIILSEPCSIIPYELEDHPMRKDYNLPPNYLSIHAEFIFIHNVALYLTRIKLKQPFRHVIYYLGAAHHYFILYFANQLAGSPFQIMHEIPARGIMDYAAGAEKMVTLIDQIENGEFPHIIPPSLEDHLKRRGRYTNLRFWHQILLLQKTHPSTEVVCPGDQYQHGFLQLYQTILGD